MKHVVMMWVCCLLFACGSDSPEAADDRDQDTSEQSGSKPPARDAGARDARVAQVDAGSTKRDAASAADAARAVDAAPSERDARVDPCENSGPADGAALHAAALALLTPSAPCAGSSCHSQRGKAAGLTLSGATDLRALLVDKAACLAPELPLVDGSGGAAALANSWLWLKLTSEVDAQGKLPESASWGVAESCGQQGDEPRGVLMPLGGEPLDEEQRATLRSWICAGAPGP